MFKRLNFIRFLRNELSTRGAVADFVCAFIDRGDNYERFSVSNDFTKYRFYHVSICEYMELIEEARDYSAFVRAEVMITKVGYHATIFFKDDCYVILTDDTRGV